MCVVEFVRDLQLSVWVCGCVGFMSVSVKFVGACVCERESESVYVCVCVCLCL